MEIKLSTADLWAEIDDEDYERVKDFSWYAKPSVNTYYACRRIRFIDKHATYYMHHFIIGYPLFGLIVDHKDGNGLNNKKENLRFVTRRSNAQNSRPKTSIYPGVCWDKYNDRYRASITVNGTNRKLGTFTSELEAFSAYLCATEEIGEPMPESELLRRGFI